MIKKFLKKKINLRIATPIILGALTLSFVGIVYASNPACGGSHTFACYKVPNQSSPETQIDEWGTCKNVTNTFSGGLDAFIPTNSSAEWASFHTPEHSLPAWFTKVNCPVAGNNGPFSVEYVSHCPNAGETQSSTKSSAISLLVQAINASNWSSAEKTAAVNKLNTNSPNSLNWTPGGPYTLSSGGYSWTYYTTFLTEVDTYFSPACTYWTADITQFGH